MSPCIADDLMAELECFDAEKATNVEKLQMAKAAMELAVDLAAEVADATNDGHAKAYFVDHLRIMATADHGFLSRDFNIDDWIEQLGRSEEKE
jgi:hypothetical protein